MEDDVDFGPQAADSFENYHRSSAYGELDLEHSSDGSPGLSVIEVEQGAHDRGKRRWCGQLGKSVPRHAVRLALRDMTQQT